MIPMAMQPTWLDKVIQPEMSTGDAQAIAEAIAKSPQFLDAIKRGLAHKPKPGTMGPTPEQFIRQEIVKAVQSVS
jgi:hypothetical protein